MKKDWVSIKSFLISLLLLFGFVACSDVYEQKDSGNKTDNGEIVLTINGQGRTIMPDITQNNFAEYKLAFTAKTEGNSSFNRTWTSGSGTVSLPAGTWELTVTAYLAGTPLLEAAKSEPALISVTSGTVTPVNIALFPIEEGVGVFKWNISFNSSFDSAVMEIYRRNGGTLTIQNDKTVTFIRDGKTQTENLNSQTTLSAGEYRAVFKLAIGDDEAAIGHALHIYQNMESSFAETFSDRQLPVTLLRCILNSWDSAAKVWKFNEADITAEHFAYLGIAGARNSNFADITRRMNTLCANNGTPEDLTGLKWLVDAALIGLASESAGFLNAANYGFQYEAEDVIRALPANGTAVFFDWTANNAVTVILGNVFRVGIVFTAPLIPTTSGLHYELTDGGAAYSVSRGTAAVAAIVIPANYNGLPVTEIADNGFLDYANMTIVAIPASVTRISASAFSGCGNLVSITVSAKNPNYSSHDGIAYNKAKTELVRIPAVSISGIFTVPDSVTNIASGTFQDCAGLTGVIIPKSVTSIGVQAFSGCSGLTAVYYCGANVSAWEGVSVSSSNDVLFNTKRYSYSETQPVTANTHWRWTDGAPEVWVTSGIEMTFIPAGTFQMDGSDSGGTSRPVTLTSGFYMGKYEVTQGQWKAVMDGANPSNFKTSDNLPVEMVSWYDAIVFCNKLSIMEGLTPAYSISGSTNPNDWGTVPTSSNETWNAVTVVSGATGYRLPTEAEWEYACRAGTTMAFNWGSNIINSSQANYNASNVDTYNTEAGTYIGRTTEVGNYAPNAWGLYDMHGNVREWCWDWYGSYTTGTQTDPRGALSGSYRVERGGGWIDLGQNLRSALRLNFAYGPDSLVTIIGFRLVRPSTSTVKGISVTEHPAPTHHVTAGSITTVLNITASVEQGTLSYQWYSNTIESNAGGTPVSGAASASFAIPTTLSAGTYYYFCEVRTDNGAPPVRSNAVKVVVSFMEMVSISAGTFQMNGSDSGGTSRPVTLTSGFYMGKYTVTQGQWKAVMNGANPSYYKTSDNLPVEMVSWYDAIVFCNKLSVMESLTPAYSINGSTNPDDWGTVPTSSNETWNAVTVESGATGYRLPTEAEWEYACRAGTTTAFNWGSNIINSTQANYDARTVDTYNTEAGTRIGRTTEVGSYTPNAWGLYDMHGNVREWCWDWYGSYTTGAQTDPRGAASGSGRVCRGGSWIHDGQILRSAYRFSYSPYDRDIFLGFRLVRPSTSTVKGISVTEHPAPTHHVTAGSITTILNITASVEQGTLSYQWYSNTIESNAGGTSVSGAASAKFAVPANLSAGIYYYFCEVRTDNGVPSVRSNVVKVTVSIANPPFTSSSVAKIEMLWIPAGTFQMDGTDSGGTTRPVTLTSGFYMGKYTVTQGQWTAVMGSLPSSLASSSTYGRGDKYPVYYTNWYDAIVFCNKLSVMEGLTPAYSISGSTNPNDWGTVPTSGNATWNAVTIVSGATGYRLPTEAQWEYACRAGTTTAFNWGSNIINSTQANYNASNVNTYNTAAGTYLGRTTEVGSYAPNAWGLYDMHGNVLEWCWDRYGSYTTGARTDPRGAVSGSDRVLRGGSLSEDGQALRSAGRFSYIPYFGYYNIGFRLLRP